MEKKQDGEVDLGDFVLRMNLSSDSEADLEEERENEMVFGPKNEPMDEAEVLSQHEPENDNCTPDISSKAVAKNESYKDRVKWGMRDEIVMCSAVVDGIKSGLQGVKSAADAIHVKKSEGFWDEVNKKLEEETGKHVSRCKLYYKFRDTRRRFLVSKRRRNPELNRHDKEVFRILGQAFGNSKRKRRGPSDAIHSDAKGDTAESDSLLEGKMIFPDMRSAKCMSKFHSYCPCTNCNPGIRKQQKDDGISLSNLRTPRQQDDDICLKNNRGDGRGMHNNEELSAKKCSNIEVVKEQNANRSNKNGEVGLDGSTIGFSGKRLKWNLRDDIVIASVVRDSVNSGLHGVSSAKDVTRFKTHKVFWDEVAEKLKEETGKCVSPLKFCTKFRTMKISYFTKKQSHVLPQNKHDEELFGILDQMFGNVRKQRSRSHGFPNSDVKGEISGGTMWTKRKSLKPFSTAHSSHLSTGSDLRKRNKRKKSEVNWNEKFFPGERTPKQDDGTFSRNNGGDGHKMSHKGFSAKHFSENNKEGKEGQNAHVGGNRKEVSLDSPTTGSSVKRLKWDLKDEIVIASFVRDGVNCGLDGVSSAKDTTHFKSHKGFWDEVAEKLNKETGQCASALKLYTKFRSIKNKYVVGKPSHVQQLNQHDKELFGILEQMFGNDGKQRSGHHGSRGSGVKGEVSGGAIPLVDTVLSTQRKSFEPSTAVHSSHPSTSPDLRNLYEVSPVLNLNEKFLGDKTPVQEGGKDCLKNGGYGVLLSTCFSAVKAPAKDGTRTEGQNENQKGKGKANVDNLVPRSVVETVRGHGKRVKWGLRDEIVIASAVQDGINCGLHGVKSLKDIMSFCKQEGFWTEMARKVKEEIGRNISTDKLFQKFRSMKYRYLAIKQSDVQEFNKHDKELFNILEQVFGNGNCGTPHSDIKGNIYGAQPFSGNEGLDKLDKQSGVSDKEDEPQLEHEKAIGQDSQTCNELPFEMLSTDRAQIKDVKYVESCPNVVNGSTLSEPSSSGNPSPCEGYQTGVTFSASTDHGVENHNRMKDKEHAGGKNKQLHDQVIRRLNETDQDYEQRLHDMLSKSESKSREWKEDQLVTDDILTGSRILEDPSNHQSDYAEVVKRLERKSRKLQLMQELYKIEQQEIEDRICQVKLKASSNP